MRKSRFRSFFNDGLFVGAIVAAAIASAALDTIAVIDTVPSMLSSARAGAAPPAASSVEVASRAALVARR